jgi:hypothetical protein
VYKYEEKEVEVEEQEGSDTIAEVGPFSLRNEQALRTRVTLLRRVGLEQWLRCPASMRRIFTDLKFEVRRSGVSHFSHITYLELEDNMTNQTKTIMFDEGNVPSHDVVKFNGTHLFCKGDRKRTNCGVDAIPLNVPVRAAIISLDFNPKWQSNVSVPDWDWLLSNRSEYSLSGGYYSATCEEEASSQKIQETLSIGGVKFDALNEDPELKAAVMDGRIFCICRFSRRRRADVPSRRCLSHLLFVRVASATCDWTL